MRGKTELLEFMDSNPMRSRTPIRVSLATGFLWKPMMAGLLVLVLMSASGGAVYAAQGSVPGEKLYPIKIASEVAREKFTISPESRFRFKVIRAERRLQEAQLILERKHPKLEIRNRKVEAAMGRYEKHVGSLKILAARYEEKGLPVARENILNAIDRIIEKHEKLIDSASSSKNGLEKAVVGPIKASLELEEQYFKRIELRKEKIRSVTPERRERMKKRSIRMKNRYRNWQQRMELLKQEEDHN